MPRELLTTETDRGEQRVLAQEWIDAKRAAVCLDCETVFRIQTACPRCGSHAWMLFSKIAGGRA